MRMGPGEDESDQDDDDLLTPEEDDVADELEGEPTRRSPMPAPED